MRILLILVFLATVYISININAASAHPGNTDSYGGHTCRTNCPNYGLYYGEYHYHNGGYYQPDYYQQGYDFGSSEGFENNRDYITSQAKLYATQEGKEDGENGYEERFNPTAPDSVCDLDFEFRAGEFQDYIDGVNEGFFESCISYANEIYREQYSIAYEKAYQTYSEALDEDIASDVDNTTKSSNSSYSWLISIGSLLAFYGFFAIIGNWDSIKNWFNKL